jgi:hypothetical protein
VKVSNDGGPGQPPLLTATPGSDVLVANAASGDVVTGHTDKDGVFMVRIAGARGDAILILLAAATDAEGTATSDYLGFSVP